MRLENMADIDRKSVLYIPVKGGDEAVEIMVFSSKDPVVTVIGLSKNVCEKAKISQFNKRDTLRQLVACFSVFSMQILGGPTLAYSSSLIPALEAPDSEIRVTRDQSAWITSIVTIAVPIGSLLGGWLMNTIGRLNAVKLSVIPYSAAWAVVATAQSYEMLLIGRFLMGASNGIITNASLLYTTEVAEKNIRGGLTCLGGAVVSLGIVIGYTFGACVHWRTTAWCYCAAPLPMLILLFMLVPESPVWLREQGKLEAASKASMYFYQDPDKVLSAPKTEGAELHITEKLAILFGRPAGLKPLLLINVLFILQQFAGVYITIFYAVIFFQESGSTLNPYITTIVIGVIRFVFCTSTSLMAGRVGRRPLMIASGLSMGLSMLAAALASQRILSTRADNGTPAEWLSWVVVVSILTYVALGSLGLQVLPWGMMTELFPHEVRALAQPFNLAAAHLYMFALLQLYPTLSNWLGGSVGMHFFFAGNSILTAAYSWLFLLETRGRTLQEIEDYFKTSIIYPGHKKRALNLKKTPPVASAGA